MAGCVWQWRGDVLSGEERNLPVWVSEALRNGDLTYDSKWNLVISRTNVKVKPGQSIIKNENGLLESGKGKQ